MVLTLILLVLGGCATAPTPHEIAAIGYGEPLTINYSKEIQTYFNDTLLDPYSAVINIGAPQTGSIRTSLVEGRKVIAGYMVPVKVNAKNRMGGYVGSKDYIFLFRNDRLIHIVTPDDLALMRYK